WVKKYSELETLLNEAIVQKNGNKIQQILSDDFEERKGNNPNSPIPKKDWIQIKMKQPIKNVRIIQQMAVRKFDNIYIVSYLSINKENPSEFSFIVDVSKEKTVQNQLSQPDQLIQSNQLMVRYSSFF